VLYKDPLTVRLATAHYESIILPDRRDEHLANNNLLLFQSLDWVNLSGNTRMSRMLLIGKQIAHKKYPRVRVVNLVMP
jgi:hypothetical protein